jgi:hypothetical protein
MLTGADPDGAAATAATAIGSAAISAVDGMLPITIFASVEPTRLHAAKLVFAPGWEKCQSVIDAALVSETYPVVPL